jgi:hypothetical protein
LLFAALKTVFFVFAQKSLKIFFGSRFDDVIEEGKKKNADDGIAMLAEMSENTVT